jgi:hypothetical protein
MENVYSVTNLQETEKCLTMERPPATKSRRGRQQVPMREWNKVVCGLKTSAENNWLQNSLRFFSENTVTTSLVKFTNNSVMKPSVNATRPQLLIQDREITQ